MLIDEALPSREASVVVHELVDAPPAAVWRAIHEANLLGGRAVRALFALRELPEAIQARLRGRPYAGLPPIITFADLGTVPGWIKFGEVPERELVLCAVGRFWERDYGGIEVAANEFVGFAEPGYAKTVAGLSISPYGQNRSVLTYESRTAPTSADAARRLRLYWGVLRPFIVVVMKAAVRAMRAEAERERPPSDRR